MWAVAGMGFVEALVLAFIILKVLGLVSFSWFWVFSPLLLWGVVVLISLFIGAVVELFGGIRKW